MNWTAEEITNAVVRFHYPPSRYAVCPNIRHSMLPWEADVIAISGSGYVTEVEIKCTKADLVRDMEKTKFKIGVHNYVDYFYYAVPENLESVAVEVAKPIGAGVYKCVKDEKGHVIVHCVSSSSLKKREQPKREEKVRLGGVAQINRLLGIRYWAARGVSN